MNVNFSKILAGIFIISLLLVGCSKEDNDTNGNDFSPTVEITEPADGDTISFPQIISANVSGDEIEKVIFIAGEDTIAVDSTTPYSTYWSFYQDTGYVVLKVFAIDGQGQMGADSITVFVPEQDYDFPLTYIAKSSHNIYLSWWHFDVLFFHRYDVYMSTDSSVDSTDELVATIQGRVGDTCAFIDNLLPEHDYMFIVYGYDVSGSLGVSNVLGVQTNSVSSAYPDDAEMISIPADTFTMGYSWSEGGGESEEYPAHPVRLNAYSIDKYEVTCARYKTFIDAGGYSNPEWWDSAGWMWKESNGITQPEQWNSPDFPCGDDYPNYPVVGVSWYEAMAFARFVGKDLPTEAQWEHAARGTLGVDENGDGYPEGYQFPWGNDFYADGTVHCNYLSGSQDTYDDGYEQSAPVGSYSDGASTFGAEDMSGNVEEWCKDWFENTYYWDNPFDNPTGPEDGTEKVTRGGSFILYSTPSLPGYFHRTTIRSSLGPSNRRYFIGFRLVKN